MYALIVLDVDLMYTLYVRVCTYARIYTYYTEIMASH